MGKEKIKNDLANGSSPTPNGRILIMSFGSIGVAISCLLLIALNNMLYLEYISWNFMLYSTAYAAPFVVLIGVIDRAIIRRYGTTDYLTRHEVLGTIWEILFTWVLSTIFITLAFILYEPEGRRTIRELLYCTPYLTTVIIGPIINTLIILLSKSIEREALNEKRHKRLREIESEILRVKYRQLRAQVNPHFLFNSLNVLTSLINKDASLATKYTKQLAQIYRYLLTNDEQDVVPLTEEIDFARQYSHIISMRYGAGLNVTIPDPPTDICNLLIMPTAIQILIENAPKHNIISNTKPLSIEISYTCQSVIVRNNMRPRPIKADSTGIGLKGLIEKYQIIDNLDVKITKTDTEFIVEVPLIKQL